MPSVSLALRKSSARQAGPRAIAFESDCRPSACRLSTSLDMSDCTNIRRARYLRATSGRVERSRDTFSRWRPNAISLKVAQAGCGARRAAVAIRARGSRTAMSILYDEAQQAIAEGARRVLAARSDKARLLALLENTGEWDDEFLGDRMRAGLARHRHSRAFRRHRPGADRAGAGGAGGRRGHRRSAVPHEQFRAPHGCCWRARTRRRRRAGCRSSRRVRRSAQ